MARNNGVFLDPVYTGEGFAAVFGNVREKSFSFSENVLFVHTGG